MDPSERRAYAKVAPMRKSVRYQLAGKFDEASMLARLEETWGAAPPGGTRYERVCRSGIE